MTDGRTKTFRYNTICYRIVLLSAGDKVKISGKFYRCYGRFEETYSREIWICHENDCKKIKTEKNRFEISGLNKGSYLIKYRNIWNQILTDSLEAVNNVVDYTLCVDKFLQRDKYPLLELFQSSTVTEIYQLSQGCFNITEKLIRIEQLEDSDLTTFRLSSDSTTRHIDKNLPLKSLTDFLKKIDLLDRVGGCTTRNHYLIQFDEKRISVTDTSCAWYGFEALWYEISTLNEGDTRK